MEIKKTNRLVENPEVDEDNASRILKEAKVLFRKKGYSAVSVNDITTASGISKPTLYHYFGDKENLYAEVLIQMMRNGHKYVEEGIKGNKTVREKLYHLTEGFMEHSPTSMTAMLYDAAESLGNVSKKRVKDAYRYYMISSFEFIFQQGIESGEIKALDPTDLALIFVSVIDAYTLGRATLSGRKFDYRLTSRLLVDALMDGFADKDKVSPKNG